MNQRVRVEGLAIGVYLGILLAAIVLLVPVLFVGHHSLREIGTPCRGHGGVEQFVPKTLGTWNYEPATVVCKDGKVGRV